MPPTDPEEYRAASRERWAAVAGGWGTHRRVMQAAAEPVSQWMVEAIAPQPGHRVLELAAGPGDTGFLAAELIAPGGTLISSDAVPEMVDQARARAAELGITNVEFADDRRRVDRPRDGRRRRRAGALVLHAAGGSGDGAGRDAPRPASGRTARARRLGAARGQPVGRGADGGARRDRGARAARSRSAEHVRLPRAAADRRAARERGLRGHRRRADPARLRVREPRRLVGRAARALDEPRARGGGVDARAARRPARHDRRAPAASTSRTTAAWSLPGLTHVAAAGA